jgi:mRNA-degrading endonuclease toxin of MazEF toxin-antitoxin module
VQPDDASTAMYGDVWLVDLGGEPEPRLVISGRRYASGRPDSVLAAVIDAPPEHPSYAAPASGLLGEEIAGVGRSQLDMFTAVYRHRLVKRLGALSEDRHASVAGRIRDWIGP